MLFANVCEGFISSCYGEYCKWRFFGFCGFFLVSCAYGEYSSCWSPYCVQDLGYIGVPPAGHALWAEVGGGFLGVHWFPLKCAWTIGRSSRHHVDVMLYVTASAGQPSLHGYDACMVYWNKGALWRNCTSFSPYSVFLFGRNPTKHFWGLITFGLGGQDILVHLPTPTC